jgi:hypothetical protein
MPPSFGSTPQANSEDPDPTSSPRSSTRSPRALGRAVVTLTPQRLGVVVLALTGSADPNQPACL